MLALVALAAILVPASSASARKPIISYLDAQGQFQLFDAETGANISPAPPVPVPAGGAAQFRWGMSLDGRYVVFNDAGKKLHLLDRQSDQQVSLPGIDKVANPGNLTVSDTGLIGYDDNSNKPTYLYDSVAKKFVSSGLDADPANPTNFLRQPRLSGDGNFMVNTCFDQAGDCLTNNDSDSDVWMQNLATKQQVPNFPDEAAGNGKDEEHPCINNDGTLIAVEKPNPVQKDILLFQRSGNAFSPVTTPNLNSATNDDRFCQLSPGGAYLSDIQNDVYKVYERSSNTFISLPNLPFDNRSTLSVPYVPPSDQQPVAGVKCGGQDATLLGTAGRDVIKGTKKRDVIAGLDGNDVIRGLRANDILCGGKGRDRLFGGRGRDKLFGGPGRDRLIGGPGPDKLRGGPGSDTQRNKRWAIYRLFRRAFAHA